MTLAYAVCSVSVLPMRSEPSHRSQQVSQALFGERMEVLDRTRNGWLKIRCEWDDYEGYVREGQVSVITYKEYRKTLNHLSTSIQDTIRVEDGQFPLSPGSSLFLQKKNLMQWGNLSFTFKGRKAAIKDLQANAQLVEVIARHFIGAPYQWGGRGIMGIDCSGFSQMVFKLMNIRILRDASQQAGQGTTVDFLQEARCGDLAFFDNEEGHINHVGILLDSQNIIHATETSGCVVIDAIDNGGIISRRLRMRTHNLRLVKRYF
jgi:cell wall-associated NlpC family hydrolase